ncbi:MAG: Polypeptide release factor (eRF1) in translation termination [Chaenotheca gracillima]|nr:MAG: Polypeptide release factor (eRF1) in translation termination [Chaenotheca gracillima]
MEQSKPSVAYLGPKSSYSNQAALECFDPATYTFKPQVHIQDIFDAVQAGTVTRGVVPFENSTNGSVVYTLDLFADRQHANPDVFVCGEAYLDVHHHLLGHTSSHSPVGSGEATPTTGVPLPGHPRARPLTSLEQVSRIYSHPQAFGQCEMFLSTYLKGVERHEVSSTSKAAEIVAQDTTKTSAAISSKVAAQVHGLETLAQGIEDREDNTTRFLILRKGMAELEHVRPDEKSKSLVSFTIDHLAPGALAEALLVFKTHKLNLTSINSRPGRVTPWNYIFFVEFSGNGLQSVDVALNDLSKVATGFRWLGTWRDELKR